MNNSVPMQPLVGGPNGTPVFRANAIVVALLEYAASHGQGLARIVGVAPDEDEVGSAFSKADWQQFAQLIGYSLEGYLDLCYVDAEARALTRVHALQQGIGAGASAEYGPGTIGPGAQGPVNGEWSTVG